MRSTVLEESDIGRIALYLTLGYSRPRSQNFSEVLFVLGSENVVFVAYPSAHQIGLISLSDTYIYYRLGEKYNGNGEILANDTYIHPHDGLKVLSTVSLGRPQSLTKISMSSMNPCVPGNALHFTPSRYPTLGVHSVCTN